jgi:uncharacterized membrane protein
VEENKMTSYNHDELVLERIVKLEVMIENLATLIEKHMAREEHEREELLAQINKVAAQHQALVVDHNMHVGEYNKRKMFIAGITAAVSFFWILAFGILEISKFFLGK